MLCLFSACNRYEKTTVTLPDGFVVNVRIADTMQKQERGLMFVEKLPENEGMLFVFPREEEQAFWMKNTLVDLDIVFIDENKAVTSIAYELPHSYVYTPDSEIPVAFGEGKYVLELAAGTAKKHNLSPTKKLQFELPE